MNRVEPGTVFTFSGHGISPRTCDSCSAVVVAMTRMVMSKAHPKRIEPSTTRCGQNSGSECLAQSPTLARLGRAKICSFALRHYSANENSCTVSSQPNDYPHPAQNCALDRFVLGFILGYATPPSGRESALLKAALLRPK